jgi:hypothetical protein
LKLYGIADLTSPAADQMPSGIGDYSGTTFSFYLRQPRQSLNLRRYKIPVPYFYFDQHRKRDFMDSRRDGIIAELRNNEAEIIAFHGQGKLERFIVWAYEHARLHMDDIWKILQ